MNIGTRKMQIKTTIRGHNTATRLSVSIGENLEKLEYLHIIDVTVKWCNSFRKLVIHQNIKHSLLLSIYSKERKSVHTKLLHKCSQECYS